MYTNIYIVRERESERERDIGHHRAGHIIV